MGLGVTWLDGALAVACLLVGLYHVGLLLGRRAEFAPAAAHAAMGVGMAAMFVPAADPLPQMVWVVIFLLVGAWFGPAVLRARSLLGDAGHHSVAAAAMLFMLLGHSGGSTAATGATGVIDLEHTQHVGAAGAAPGLLLTVVALVFAAWFITDVIRRVTHRAPTRLPIDSTAGTSVGADQPALKTRAAAGTAVAARSPLRVSRAPQMPVAHLVMSAAMAVMFLGMA